MAWWDFYKLWTYSFEPDPLEKKVNAQQVTGAGVTQPDAIPDIRQDGSFWGGGRGVIRLRDTNDFVDLSSVTNRTNRYKEYERLRNMAEIEMAMTVYADEACLAGNTKVATPFYGLKTIRWLAKNKSKERFLVYSWNFDINDYVLAWAFDPRKVKTEKTVKIKLDDGSFFVATPDHRVLMQNGEWMSAGSLQEGSKLKACYREPARSHQIGRGQYPRVLTMEGWKHERQMIDEWRSGEKLDRFERVNQACRLLAQGVSSNDTAQLMGHQWKTIRNWIEKEGFTQKELQFLGSKKKCRRVIGVMPGEKVDVYDLSVEKHQNFCGESVVFHNCQRGEEGHVCKITSSNEDVVEELEFLFFNRKMLNIDRTLWNKAKNLFIMGDHFGEVVINPENPKDGILKLQDLPPDSIYRIETTKGKLIEFQQSKEGPDYQSLTRAPVTQATDADLQQATAIRFTAQQVIHWRIGDDRKQFYPYGVSLIEPARGPAHQLRLMEDAMVVYRLCLIGNSRVRTNNGWKYIKDIQNGDYVYAFSENGQMSTRVVGHSNNGTQQTYKITSQHVELTGNDIHPILVQRDGEIQYVKIKDLQPKKDKLICATNPNEQPVKILTVFDEKWARLSSGQKRAFRNIQYENVSDLMRQCGGNVGRTKQFLYSRGVKSLPYEQAVCICEKFELDPNQLTITNKNQRNPERINLPEYVDEEFARLFGFLIGDGSLRETQLMFAAGTDESLNQYYAGLLKKYFGAIRFEHDKRSTNPIMGNYVVDSHIACKIFSEMGYICGAHNKRIPSWVYNAPKNIRRAFVEGISAADGCERYTKVGTWFSTIELCNELLVADIKEVWFSIGLGCGKLGHRKRECGHEIESGRKMKPCETYFVTISDCPLPEYENIWSVEYVGDEDVYDLTVENEEHNFIVNGTPVSNTRAPERRVFYIDVANLAPSRAEGFIERIKDQFRKKKVAAGGGNRGQGVNSIEERWHPPAADEDYWLPIRQNSNTRIETLPGAQNLGEIDDALYFRNKLFTALNFPKNYFSNEDPNATRITLSAQDVKFARMIERLQAHLEDGLVAIAERHLSLRGIPEEEYDDLAIKMTPPSDWRELSRSELVTTRINNANSLKGSLLMSDFDILTKWLQYSDEDTEEMQARMKIQKLEDFRLQVLASNPQLLGIGVPGAGEEEIGAEVGGPSPMLSPDQGAPGEQQAPGGEQQAPGGEQQAPGGEQQAPGGEQQAPGGEQQAPGGEQQAPGGEMQQPALPAPAEGPAGGPGIQAVTLPMPSKEDIKKFDLEIQSYAREQDAEEIDYSTE